MKGQVYRSFLLDCAIWLLSSLSHSNVLGGRMGLALSGSDIHQDPITYRHASDRWHVTTYVPWCPQQGMWQIVGPQERASVRTWIHTQHLQHGRGMWHVRSWAWSWGWRRAVWWWDRDEAAEVGGWADGHGRRFPARPARGAACGHLSAPSWSLLALDLLLGSDCLSIYSRSTWGRLLEQRWLWSVMSVPSWGRSWAWEKAGGERAVTGLHRAPDCD